MSGTFPATPGPSKLTVIPSRKNYNDISHGGTRQNRAIAGNHKWRIKAEYTNLSVDEQAPIVAFIEDQDGRAEKFQFELDTAGYPTPRGIATGTPLLKGAATLGATSVLTDGWTINQTGILKAATFFTIAGHKKLYRLTADADSNGIGEATLVFKPELYLAYADNAAITINNVQATVQLSKDSFEIPIRPPQLTSFVIIMDEVTN